MGEQRWFRSVYERDLSPLLVPGLVAGLFPKYRATPSRRSFFARLPAPSTYYAVLVVAFWICYTAAEALFRLKTRRGGRLALYRSLSYEAALLLMPVTHWGRGQRVKTYLASWERLEARYRHVTGTVLVLDARRAAVFALAGIVLLCSLSVARYAHVQPRYWLRYAPAVWYVLFVRYLMNALWILSFHSLSVASRSFSHELRVAASNAQHNTDLGTAVLADYRVLWLDLSMLIRDAGNVMHGAYSVSLALHFIHMTLCAYSCVDQLGKDWALTAEVALEGTASLLFALGIVTAAQRASDQGARGVQQELERIVEAPVGVAIKRQVLMFLKAIDANKPTITLGEFVTVNNEFFSTMLITLVSYLVVLLQVQSTLTEDDASPVSTPTST